MGQRQFGQVLVRGGIALALVLAACGGKTSLEKTTHRPALEPSRKAEIAEEDQVRAILSAVNLRALGSHRCWSKAASDNFHLEGRLELELLVVSGGESKVSVVGDTLRDSVLQKCMISLWETALWGGVFEAGDRVSLPPYEFVAPERQFVVSEGNVIPQEIGKSIRSQRLLHELNSGNTDMSMALLHIKAGADISLHNHQSEEYLFVLEGAGILVGSDGPVQLVPGDAVRIPAGAVHGLIKADAGTMQLVQVFSPAGPEDRYWEGGEDLGTKEVPWSKNTLMYRGKKRATKVVKKAVMASAAISFLEGKGSARILFDGTAGLNRVSMSALSLLSGASMGPHVHDKASEYLLVLEGQAELNIAGVTIEVQPGDAIQIPAGVLHGAITQSSLKALQWYSSAGPEQRYKNK